MYIIAIRYHSDDVTIHIFLSSIMTLHYYDVALL